VAAIAVPRAAAVAAGTGHRWPLSCVNGRCGQ